MNQEQAQMRRVKVVEGHLTPNPTSASKSQFIDRVLFHPAKAKCLAQYDYIVVGGGSSGCALAARLAEKLPNKSVLLIDAGGDCRQFRIDSPFLTCPKLQNSDIDFAYRTTSQKKQQGRQSYWPRGKVLGGCSSINFMLAVRGDSRGYDKWANELGCPGWSFADVEKYFKRLEDYRGRCNLPHRGRHGPVTITDNRDLEYLTKPTAKAFVDGCAECGVPEVDDYNRPGLKAGAGVSQTTIRDGKRCSSSIAYLFGETGAFATCPNLSCLTHEQCARVTFDVSSGVPRANGVELISGPVIGARQEVILCAGAVGSAQILLLSGVGPKAHLESKNVKVVADLPGVGQSLKDHAMVALAYEKKDGLPDNFMAESPMMLLSQLGQYALFNKGIFTTSWVQSMAFFDSSIQKPTDANDIQIHFIPFLGSDEEQGKINFGFDREKHEMPPRRDPTPLGVSFMPSLLQPKSVGFIELASNNPKDHPIIEPNYLDHPDDLKVFCEAWRFCERVAESKAMKPLFKGQLYDESVKFAPGSDEYVQYKIKRDMITIYHPTSTCKMGPDSDPLSVLDPATLKVKKVTNLRVADCSSFPDIPAANTNLPAIMIGERCADLIAFGPIGS